MFDALKNALLAGLGAVAITQEKLEASLEDLIRRGVIARDQGMKLVEELVARGQSEGDQVTDRLSREVSRLLERSPIVMRREFLSLDRRVRAIEAQLGMAAPDEVDAPDSGSPADAEGRRREEEGGG